MYLQGVYSFIKENKAYTQIKTQYSLTTTIKKQIGLPQIVKVILLTFCEMTDY